MFIFCSYWPGLEPVYSALWSRIVQFAKQKSNTRQKMRENVQTGLIILSTNSAATALETRDGLCTTKMAAFSVKLELRSLNDSAPPSKVQRTDIIVSVLKNPATS